MNRTAFTFINRPQTKNATEIRLYLYRNALPSGAKGMRPPSAHSSTAPALPSKGWAKAWGSSFQGWGELRNITVLPYSALSLHWFHLMSCPGRHPHPQEHESIEKPYSHRPEPMSYLHESQMESGHAAQQLLQIYIFISKSNKYASFCSNTVHNTNQLAEHIKTMNWSQFATGRVSRFVSSGFLSHLCIKQVWLP